MPVPLSNHYRRVSFHDCISRDNHILDHRAECHYRALLNMAVEQDSMRADIRLPFNPDMLVRGRDVRTCVDDVRSGNNADFPTKDYILGTYLEIASEVYGVYPSIPEPLGSQVTYFFWIELA